MANDIVTTVVGNLTADPELRFSKDDRPYATMSIASTPRVYRDGEWVDGETTFMNAAIWGNPANNVVESLSKGDRVVAHGRLLTSVNTEDDMRYLNMTIDELGASLTFVTAELAKNEKPKGKGKGKSKK